MSVTNSLAYFAAASVTKKKSFMTMGVFSQHSIFLQLTNITRLKNNVSDKLSSLFCHSVTDEENQV
jgi:hypothetical protein